MLSGVPTWSQRARRRPPKTRMTQIMAKCSNTDSAFVAAHMPTGGKKETSRYRMAAMYTTYCFQAGSVRISARAAPTEVCDGAAQHSKHSTRLMQNRAAHGVCGSDRNPDKHGASCDPNHTARRIL